MHSVTTLSETSVKSKAIQQLYHKYENWGPEWVVLQDHNILHF